MASSLISKCSRRIIGQSRICLSRCFSSPSSGEFVRGSGSFSGGGFFSSIVPPNFNPWTRSVSLRYLSQRSNDSSASVRDQPDGEKPQNWMELSVFIAELCRGRKPVFSLFIDVHGNIGVSSSEGRNKIYAKPTMELTAAELDKLISKYSVQGCMIYIATDKEVVEFMERFAHCLFKTAKLLDVKYTFRYLRMSYDEVKLFSIDSAKTIVERKNWMVPSMFIVKICGQYKPTFTLKFGSDSGIEVARSGLDGCPSVPLLKISSKGTSGMAEELHNLISEYNIGGCFIETVPDEKVSKFIEFYAHRLFRTGKLQNVNYTFRPMEISSESLKMMNDEYEVRMEETKKRKELKMSANELAEGDVLALL